MASLLALPLPLLLLIHLHLLEFPLANSNEYDTDLFNANRRGLRERTQAMQDITVFLVGQIETTKSSVKTLFPMYPCHKPPDTTAFRATLTKWIEGVRHAALHRGSRTITSSKSSSKLGIPSSRSNTSIATSRSNNNLSTMPASKSSSGLASSSSSVSSSKANTKLLSSKSTLGSDLNSSPTPEIGLVDAWWWKDIVVRKSLLEECAGLRFERLLLALSNHALFISLGTNQDLSVDLAKTDAADQAALIYTGLVSATQESRVEWTRVANISRKRREDVKLLRNHILSADGLESQKYAELTTARLTALCTSKLDDLKASHFKDGNGMDVLQALAALSGLETSLHEVDPVANVNNYSSLADIVPSKGTASSQSPPILPIAAAHHPSHIRKLKRALFSSKDKKEVALDQSTASVTQETTDVDLVPVRLNAAIERQKLLRDALTRAKNTQVNIAAKSTTSVAVATKGPVNHGKPKAKKTARVLYLNVQAIAAEEKCRVEFSDSLRLTPSLFASLDLMAPTTRAGEEEVFESQVTRVRAGLTAWPADIQGQFVLVDETSLRKRKFQGAASSTMTATPRSHHRRTSSRFSIARRASMFPSTSSGSTLKFAGVKEEDAEVERIVDGIQDTSMELIAGDFTNTPKAAMHTFKTPQAHRTMMVPPSSSRSTRLDTIRKPKQSFQMPELGPAFALPDLMRMSMSGSAEDSFEIEEFDHDALNEEANPYEESDEEDFINEGPSMTLRDILLRAVDGDAELDLDLLDETEDDATDESFTWE